MPSRFRVTFSIEAEEQLAQLYRYIAQASSTDRADRYVGALAHHCHRLAIFPYRGVVRDSILPGLRITHFRKRTVIAFVVLDNRVEILGVFHGGRDYAAILRQGK
jgi:plasmid stabilization system protein ParE